MKPALFVTFLCLACCAAFGASVRQVAEFSAPSSASGDEFGLSAAIQGDTAVAGAPSPIFGSAGLAYVFTRSGGVWRQTAQLGDGVSSGDELGWSVAIGGNVIAAGALAGNGGNGSVFVFVRPPGGWENTTTPTAELTIPNGATRNRLGAGRYDR
jgi:hypothetical protein